MDDAEDYERQHKYDERDANPETFRQIFVAGLDRRSGETEIREIFEKYGDIDNINIKNDYAFVLFNDHDSAVTAIKGVHNSKGKHGEDLRVEHSSMYYFYFGYFASI